MGAVSSGAGLPDRRILAALSAVFLLLLPFVFFAVVRLGLAPSDVVAPLVPRTGPPDTLRGTRIAIPRAPDVLTTSYLERVLANKSPRDIAIDGFSDRYHITRSLARSIMAAAEAERIDPELAFRLIRVESVFDAKAVSRVGALGLTQLMPGTARSIDPTVSDAEILDPQTNMRLGFTNLRNMIQEFKGDVRLGVIAYNRGPVAVSRALRKGKDPENGYGLLVLGARAHGGRPYTGPGVVPAR